MAIGSAGHLLVKGYGVAIRFDGSWEVHAMANFADKMLRCVRCGASFVFTVDEQRLMAAKGEVVEPRLCPACRVKGSTDTKITGRVKWFDERKGYGFISRDDGGRDVFVHYTGIEGGGFRTVHEGRKVEFEVEVTPKGPRAVKVVKLSEGDNEYLG